MQEKPCEEFESESGEHHAILTAGRPTGVAPWSKELGPFHRKFAASRDLPLAASAAGIGSDRPVDDERLIRAPRSA
ncbi:hypothetical protein BB934_43215 (plasmid) [Microvirga ossetica]|uniref:Uncharacterized protein n=1 Tax=Microvirga ossetica TaxID=1882682 RepID=A0A1B2EYN5_9HYPH|nr:hypothetical protein BB934_43215 [Microvirga ossetica]